jgi:hypothetical protein
MNYPLSDVMDRSAVLLNDAAKTDYTYAVQLPFVAMALDELQEIFEQNNIPVTNEVTAGITIPAGVKEIGYQTLPALPNNLIEIQQLWEQQTTGSSGYIPMTKMEFLPHYLENQLTSNLVYWAWEGGLVKFLGATLDVQIKFDYISSIFPRYITENTIITVNNTKSFLSYRTGGLIAEFSGENQTKAVSLNNDSVLALDRSLSIPVKGMQSVATRRRPFRASYAQRQTW